MTTHAYLDHGLSILKARLNNPASTSTPSVCAAVHPFITLSRESCAGATSLGLHLLPLLNSNFGEEGQEWVLLDKDLLGYALSRHELSEQLAQYLPEDRVSEIGSTIEEIIGLHPSLWDLEERVSQTIIQLARLGRFIFVGRAAHLLTQNLPGGFHLRLIASKDVRVRRLMAERSMDFGTAQDSIDKVDNGRRRFVKAHYGRDIDDPHTYDLVVNTDRISPEAAASLVIEALRSHTPADIAAK
jgi:cytidylate kinase